MGCEASREDKPNDLIKSNECVLKIRAKTVSEISEVKYYRKTDNSKNHIKAFFNLNRIEDGKNYIEKTRIEKGVSNHLGIEYSREDYRLIVNPFLKAFFVKMDQDLYSNRKLELYNYLKFKTYLYLLATGTTEEKAKAIFRSYDTEGNESLSKEELETIFRDLFESVKQVGEILSELDWVKIEQEQDGIKLRVEGAIHDIVSYLLKDGKQEDCTEQDFIRGCAEYVKITQREVFSAEGGRKIIMPFVFVSTKDKATRSSIR